jgi:hypothetical protein
MISNIQRRDALLLRYRFALGLLAIIVITSFGAANAQFLQRQVPEKALVLEMQTQAPSGRIIVKFSEDSEIVVRQDGLAGGSAADRARFADLLAEKSNGAPLERRFSQSFADLAQLRDVGQAKVRRPLPNLNAYGVLDYSERGYDRATLLELVKHLLADPAIETAYLEPLAVPAALGFDAFTGKYTPPTPEIIDEPTGPAPLVKEGRDSPDYTHLQGYLEAPRPV